MKDIIQKALMSGGIFAISQEIFYQEIGKTMLFTAFMLVAFFLLQKFQKKK
jgi:hypothetical protein